MHQIWDRMVKDIPHARPLKGSADFDTNMHSNMNINIDFDMTLGEQKRDYLHINDIIETLFQAGNFHNHIDLRGKKGVDIVF